METMFYVEVTDEMRVNSGMYRYSIETAGRKEKKLEIGLRKRSLRTSFQNFVTI